MVDAYATYLQHCLKATLTADVELNYLRTEVYSLVGEQASISEWRDHTVVLPGAKACNFTSNHPANKRLVKRKSDTNLPLYTDFSMGGYCYHGGKNVYYK